MFKIEGLNELQNNLKALADNARELDGQHVPVSELLTSSFLTKHTRFLTADDFFKASGFKMESAEDFEAIPDDQWDEFIRSVSSFQNWQTMIAAAGKEWVSEKLGL